MLLNPSRLKRRGSQRHDERRRAQETTDVAHSLSAKKRIRQNIKRRARNRARKESIKTQVKTFLGAVASGDFGKAETEFRKAAHWLDKVAAKGTIHKNTASRRRSRLARRLNAARTTAASAPAGGAGTTGKGRKAKSSSSSSSSTT
jgi:small subunit ribosomal protein S20